jgi:hypothetical protein
MAKATRVQWQDPTGNAAMRRKRVRKNRAAAAQKKPWQSRGEVLGMQPASVQRAAQYARTGRNANGAAITARSKGGHQGR